jgi:integrase
MTSVATAAYIAGWRPVSVPGEAAEFARAVVARAGPSSRERANSLLWAAARLAAFAIPLGLDPVPEVLLHPSTIERFAAGAAGICPGSRRTLRTNLRFLARQVVPQLAPADVPLGRERAKAPYTDAEIAGYLALADAQPTQARRARAAALVGLGAGAGLTGADLRAVRGSDIARRCGGVVVSVHDRRARVVPVLARYHQRLLDAAAFAGTALVTGGTDVARKNITTPVISALSGGTGLPRLQVTRLRASWLRDCAQLLGLATFLHAAGISCSQRLGDVVATLEPAGEAEAIRLLGGSK